MELQVSDSLKILLGITIAIYIVAMFVLAHFAHKRVTNTEDYIVAGRRLPLYLAWATLIATWFGAGTILTVCTEVSRNGLQRIALDPVGSGLCLIIAGLFYAKPLWNMGLLTLCDFFRRRFGVRVEVVSALLMVPSYFGWIAAQFVALAQVFELFFGLPVGLGVLFIAVFGTGYTLLGGMWSVTLTDSVQITLVMIGLVVLTFNVLTGVGHGSAVEGYMSVMNSIQQTSPEKLVFIPTESASKFWGWVSILAAGALGNIPGQDLMQRVFASRSAETAKHACWLAGIAYITFGMLPVLLGLVAATYFKDQITDTVLPALANAFLHPVMAVVFVVVIMSAVLSTVTSSILSPATVLAQNLLLKLKFIKMDSLTLNRWCVVIIAAGSLAMSYSGQGAFALLENAYSLTMVSLFVPLTLGLYTRPRNELPAMVSMVVGAGIFLPQYLIGWEYFLQGIPPFDALGISLSLTATFASLVAYVIVHYYQVNVLKLETDQDDLFETRSISQTEPSDLMEAGALVPSAPTMAEPMDSGSEQNRSTPAPDA